MFHLCFPSCIYDVEKQILAFFLFFRSLGEQEAKNEFNELFDDLIVDVVESMKKYSDIVKQLESLLDLEKETLIIKKKVATFSLDYDDDLVNLKFIIRWSKKHLFAATVQPPSYFRIEQRRKKGT